MTGSRKFQSRAAARKAYDADVEADKAAHHSVKATYWETLKATADLLPEPLRTITLLHLPGDLSGWFENCQSCGDEYGDRHTAPCPTLLAIIRAYAPQIEDTLGDKFQPQRRFEDYWPDPHVTVTVAYHTTVVIDGERRSVVPLDQLTARLSELEPIKSRFVTTSQNRIKKLVGW